MPINAAGELYAALRNKEPDLVVEAKAELELHRPIVLDYPVRVTGGRFKVQDGPAFVIAASGVTLDSCTIIGGRDENDSYSSAQKLIHATGTQERPLAGITVRGCRLWRSRADNVWLEWCVDSLVTNNVITEYLYSGVMGVSANRVVVSGNVIRDAPLSDGVVNTYGIAFTDLDNTEQARSRDCSAVGNQVSLIDWEGIDTHGGDGISVVANTVVGCPRGIALVTGNETRHAAPTRCVVSANTVNGAGSRRPVREAIFLGGIPNVPANATITGNHMTGHQSAFGGLSYIDRPKTFIGDNNFPLLDWSAITMDGDYTADPANPPQYRIDGNTIWLRGNVIPKADGRRTVIGHLRNGHAWPGALMWLGESHGLDPAAGRGVVGVLGADSDNPGRVQMFAVEGTDTSPYPLSGSYQAL
ncbi:parallel beta helix pectate lyase-like protein [Labedaea rhizosphaerae]|uniref:Parallel beta helix pectate lyase-like protein n=2 Tax=Labedaea rhizosphaerae TaxID=598644 RepID=A0A4R6SDK1_LABRH|nr:parallel beta helix pectate lyase-like protein [Labedaea rhizosphaerae]